jgi:hypothetical protein
LRRRSPTIADICMVAHFVSTIMLYKNDLSRCRRRKPHLLGPPLKLADAFSAKHLLKQRRRSAGTVRGFRRGNCSARAMADTLPIIDLLLSEARPAVGKTMTDIGQAARDRLLLSRRPRRRPRCRPRLQLAAFARPSAKAELSISRRRTIAAMSR